MDRLKKFTSIVFNTKIIGILSTLYGIFSFIRDEFLPTELAQKLRLGGIFSMIDWYWWVIGGLLVWGISIAWESSGKRKEAGKDKMLSKISIKTNEIKNSPVAKTNSQGNAYAAGRDIVFPPQTQEGQIKSLDQKDIRPKLNNEEPEVIEATLPGILLETGYQYSPYIVLVKFFNKPKITHEDSAAKKVHSQITYYDSSMNLVFPKIRGRWDIKPKWEGDQGESPIRKTMKGEGFEEVDFEPSREKPHTLVLAIKYTSERFLYAINLESFQYKNLRNPKYELDGKKFYIQVTLHPAYSKGIERWFVLFYGGIKYLEIKQMTQREIKDVKNKLRS